VNRHARRVPGILLAFALLGCDAAQTRTPGQHAQAEAPGATRADTVVIEVEWFGESVGRIDAISGRTRTVALDDRNLVVGLRDGLIGIREGESRRIEIPWEAGYGEGGRPPHIPPREDLAVVARCLEVLKGASDGA